MEFTLLSAAGLGGVLGQLWNYTFFLNMLLAIIIVFFERREPCTVWAWLLVLYFLPVVGFILYLFLGQDIHKQYMFRMKLKADQNNCMISSQEERQRDEQQKMLQMPEELERFRSLVWYNFRAGGCVYTGDNQVTVLSDGEIKFQELFQEMRRATRFIHIQYYIIQKDELLEEMLQILQEKCSQGVEVRLLYDSLGSRSMHKKDWQRVRSMGIQTGDFFPAHFGRLQGRINYRNHRKIVVIDGSVGFVGGYNIGREYISKDKRFGYWRDTHLKIVGSSVAALSMRFALDWNYATGENLFLRPDFFQVIRREEDKAGSTGIQIVASGPDQDRSCRQIRDNYLTMIHLAKKSIYIQTPYFIPDEAIFAALLVAVRSGVDVRLMIPCKPDHPFVYWATYAYMGELLQAGATCYVYENGFLHSKGMVVDSVISCYGTANMDIRSFRLNFEINAVLFDSALAEEMSEIFLQDIDHCRQITLEDYADRSLMIRFKEQLFRLLSPLM